VVRSAAASLVVVVAVIVGCASIIDIPDLQPPPAGAGSEAGAEGGAEAACVSSTDAVTLTVTPRGVHTALDETDVYFTRGDPPRDSAILRCAKCGCDKATELVKLTQPGGIAVDDRYVFWTENPGMSGSLNRIDKRDPTNKMQIANLETPIGVAVDADSVYWTVIGGGPMGVATAGVYRARKSDLGAVTFLVRTDDIDGNLVPYAVAVDETHVYYSTAPDLNDQDALQPCKGSTGQVRRVLKNGPALQRGETIASGQPCPLGLALGGDAVYWANLGAGTALAGSIWTAGKTRNTPVKLAGGLGRPTSVSFHGGRLAWNVPASQRVESCTPPACTDLATLAGTQLNPSGMSADGSGIYWMVLGTPAQNFRDGALRRAPGPP
jgi:hypothetical protein